MPETEPKLSLDNRSGLSVRGAVFERAFWRTFLYRTDILDYLRRIAYGHQREA
jgi:hypothetical protein